MAKKTIQDLFDELESQKESLDKDIGEIEEQKETVRKLFPQKFTYDAKPLMEERLKMFSHFFDVILKYRSKKTDIIKEQINLMMKDNSLRGEGNSREVAQEFYQFLEEQGVDLSKLTEELEGEIDDFTTDVDQETISAAMPSTVSEAESSIRDVLSTYEYERDFSPQEKIIEEQEKISDELKEEKRNKDNQKMLREIKQERESRQKDDTIKRIIS